MILNIIEVTHSSGEVTPVLVINEKWLKPLNRLKTTFHENCIDINTGIINALWQRDPLCEGRVIGTFDCLKEVDSFNFRRLSIFLAK